MGYNGWGGYKKMASFCTHPIPKCMIWDGVGTTRDGVGTSGMGWVQIRDGVGTKSDFLRHFLYPPHPLYPIATAPAMVVINGDITGEKITYTPLDESQIGKTSGRGEGGTGGRRNF